MRNLFDQTAAAEFHARLDRLRTDSPAQWGRMNVAQALAHCTAGLEMALGDFKPARKLIGRLLGRLIKPLAIGNDEPMRKNTPTVGGMEIADQRELDAERGRLHAAIDRFVSAGPPGCTTHPHAFFGPLTS